MASCCGGGRCYCSVIAGANVTVTGTGGADNPFVVAATGYGEGSKWLSGNGVPAGVLGNVGDWYLDLDTGWAYEKTGAATWTFRIDLTASGTFYFPEDFGAVGDGVTDDTTAMLAWMDGQIADKAEGLLKPGSTYRVTAPIKRRDSGYPFSIHGVGGRQSYIIGDFVGPGEGIIDLSNDNATSYSTGGHRISGIGFLGRGTAGDPVGLMLLNSFENIVEDIDAPAGGTGGVPASWTGNASGAPLANSVVLVTNDNNSKFINVRGQGGWQPKAFDTSSATISFTSGSNAVTASAAVFTAAMSGKTITFAKGSDVESAGSDNAIWRATFTYVSPTTGTLDINAPSTAAGVRFVIDMVRGSITSGSNSLVLDDVVGLSANYVGMQVHVVGGAVKTDASSQVGLLSTTITAVNVGTKTLTLADPATSTVSSGQIMFCPNIFLGSFQGDPAGRQTNHSWWDNVHSEGFACAGLIINKALYANFDNLKVHGAAYSYASDWGECYYPLYISEAKSIVIENMQAAYGILGSKIAIAASRGCVTLDGVEISNLLKDLVPIQCVNVTDEFRLSLGSVVIFTPLTAFASTFLPYSSTKAWNVVCRGPMTHRDKQGTVTKNPMLVGRGVTAVEGAVVLADDTAYTLKPPGTYGFMQVATQSAGCGAIFMYRTSDDPVGSVLVTPVFTGTNTDVLTVATNLAGTTGTDGRFTVACDSLGNIRVENRRGFTVRVGLLPTAHGG